MNELARRIFDIGPQIRYVAVYSQGTLQLNQKDGLVDASASESDRFEELLVNPTVLTALTQRGDIDCGGLSYVLVRYGKFFQFVAKIPGGHVSVALEPTADLALVEQVHGIVAA